MASWIVNWEMLDNQTNKTVGLVNVHGEKIYDAICNFLVDKNNTGKEIVCVERVAEIKDEISNGDKT